MQLCTAGKHIEFIKTPFKSKSDNIFNIITQKKVLRYRCESNLITIFYMEAHLILIRRKLGEDDINDLDQNLGILMLLDVVKDIT